nr:DNA polymerase III subunit beta [uncultured bacterium]
MQFTVSRKKFVQALSFVPSVIEKKTALPVLSHCLLKAAGDKVTIVGTDLDIVISEECRAQTQIEGSLCVPGVLLHDIVKRLEGYDTLSFSHEDQLFLRCGRSEFRLSVLPAEQFPDVSQLPLTTIFNVNPAVLKKMIDEVRLCMIDDDQNVMLNSLFLHTTNESGDLYGVSTDLHQLALSKISLEKKLDLQTGLVVGRKAITEIRRLLLDDNAKQVTLGASHARIQCDVVTDDLVIMFTARLVDGIYPEYLKVVESMSETSIVFNRSVLQSALERMIVVVDIMSKGIMLNFSNNLMTMTAVSVDSGSGKEELEIKFDGDPFTIQVNAFYLLNMVKQIDTEQVEIHADNPHEAMHIKPFGLEYPHYMIMPLVE